jgi:hypothetical protein
MRVMLLSIVERFDDNMKKKSGYDGKKNRREMPKSINKIAMD